MTPGWLSFPDADAAARACAERIGLLLDQAVATSATPTLVVSGGSTPKLMLPHLADLRLEWKKIHLFWADERAVPPDHPESNYRLVREHFVERARFPEKNVHRVCGESGAARAAALYAAEIREFFGLEPGELPRFDVVQLGMGADSHTASLFPGDPLLEDRSEIAAAARAPKPPPSRVTLLPGVLLSARNTVFLAAGDDKAAAVHTVFHGQDMGTRHPAQLVTRHGRHVEWFLDGAAARLFV